MVPLLQTPEQNPHATLITLFMNAVEEAMTLEDRLQGMASDSRALRDLREYLPLKEKLASRYDPVLMKVQYAQELVTRYDHVFER
jgi:hypothetical protein